MKILDRAIFVAREAHHGQKYDHHDYDFHLNHVCEVLIKFGITDTDLLVSAWLHDIIEDTVWTKEDVIEEFGETIAQIVDSVTDEIGKNRKERKMKTYPKIIKDKRSVILKLADRIANIKYCLKIRSKQLNMYVKENAEFSRKLRYEYKDSQLEVMWAYLDALMLKAKDLT